MENAIDPSKLEIVLFPDPVLKRVAAPVECIDDSIRGLVDRMFELMRASNGVGLAAPQVGVSKRLFVCNPTLEPGDDMVCINPEFVELEGQEGAVEGCLSIPGVSVNMRRGTRAVLRAANLDGEVFEYEAEGLPARIWQHENDHLDGRLIVDSMSTEDEIANRRAIRQLRDDFKRARR